jgi:hypothetical protein
MAPPETLMSRVAERDIGRRTLASVDEASEFTMKVRKAAPGATEIENIARDITATARQVLRRVGWIA